MYAEKIEEILEDLENKEIEIAGGAVVGMNLATINSLIKYIAKLTIGKKKYIDVEEKVKEILEKAETLKQWSLKIIDGDKIVLENILEAYKSRNEDNEIYQETCKDAVDFCMEVLKIAIETKELTEEIGKVGNKMLASDFEICKYYAEATVKSAIANVKVNLEPIENQEYKNEILDILKGME